MGAVSPASSQLPPPQSLPDIPPPPSTLSHRLFPLHPCLARLLARSFRTGFGSAPPHQRVGHRPVVVLHLWMSSREMVKARPQRRAPAPDLAVTLPRRRSAPRRGSWQTQGGPMEVSPLSHNRLLSRMGGAMVACHSLKEMALSTLPRHPSSQSTSACGPGGALLQLSVPRPHCGNLYLHRLMPSLPHGGPPRLDMQAVTLPRLCSPAAPTPSLGHSHSQSQGG
jgi:hypothetical protein